MSWSRLSWFMISWFMGLMVVSLLYQFNIVSHGWFYGVYQQQSLHAVALLVFLYVEMRLEEVEEE